MKRAIEEITIKSLKLIKLGGSSGFIIPVQYLEEKMDGGLVVGDEYTIRIGDAE